VQSRLGGEPKEWQWGRVHTVTFAHVFGVQPLLGRLFNVGPYAVGGTHATVSVGQYFLSQPFVSRVGPSMRQIMNLADVNDTRVVLPPGQSGNLFYKHIKTRLCFGSTELIETARWRKKKSKRLVPMFYDRLQNDDIGKFESLLKTADSICVLTGAGISAESGVATFRGTDGYGRS